MKFNKDTQIQEVILHDTKTAKIFMRRNIHCLSCPFTMEETIEVAAKKHNVNLDELLKEINEVVADEN